MRVFVCPGCDRQFDEASQDWDRYQRFRQCPRCGQATAVPDERTALCPMCAREMTNEQMGFVVLDRCERCDQVWFDIFELDRVLKNERGRSERFVVYEIPFTPLPADRGLKCPRCDKDTLVPGLASDLPLHRCSICHGFLVGAGSLGSIPLSGRSTIASSVAREQDTVLRVAEIGATAEASSKLADLIRRIFSRG